MTDLNEYAKEIHQQNVDMGWWDDPHRCLFECLQLISTEVAEATEGERKNLMDDHLPHRKMGEVELADALIRTLDLLGRVEGPYEPAIAADDWEYLVAFFKTRSVGFRHLGLNVDIAAAARELMTNEVVTVGFFRALSVLIDNIRITAESFGYDVLGAMDEKLEYNKQRADHKRENRAKPGGKKF